MIIKSNRFASCWFICQYMYMCNTTVYTLCWIALRCLGWRGSDSKNLLALLPLCSIWLSLHQGQQHLPALSRCSHGNASKELKDRQNRERESGGKNKPEILCYCNVALFIVPDAFLGCDSKPCHTCLSPSVRGEDQSETQRVGAVALCWNSRHPSHPLNQHKLHTFVTGVHLYIFQWFESIAPC